WSGLRGVRFVRPTLVVGQREVLATLEHKPWAPSSDRPWVAAFPWAGRMPDLDELELAVAPTVTVPLGEPAALPAPDPDAAPHRAQEPAPATPARPPALALVAPAEPAPAARPARAGDDVAEAERRRVRQLEHELEDALRERDALRLVVEEARLAAAAADA